MGLPRVAAEARAADRGRAGGDHRRTARRGRSGSSPASTSPTTPRSRASRASSPPTTTSTRTSAGSIRTGGAAATPILTDLIVGARSGRRRRADKRASSTSTGRSRGCARSTATRCSSSSPSPTIRRCATCSSFVQRGRARSRRGGGRDIRSRAVGTGPLSPQANGSAARASCSKRTPNYRDAYFPASDDPGYAALETSMKGKKSSRRSARSRSPIIDEDLPRLLQFERAGSTSIVLRGEVASRLLAETASSSPSTRARHRPLRVSRSRSVLGLLQRRRPGDRRHEQGPHRAAPRNRARGSTSTR